MELVLESMWKTERVYGQGTETAWKMWIESDEQTFFMGFFEKWKQLGKNIRKSCNHILKIVTKSTKVLFTGSIERPEVRTESDYQQKAASLLDLHGNSILRLVYSYLHNLSDAEDILQDTLVQYLKTRPVLETPAHEKSWLLTVAANLSKNRISYNQVRQADELQEELVVKEREDLSFVWEAVRELPEKYREVIHLFHYEGYSTTQIAKILGRKESTVRRSDLRRGQQRLKEVLKEAYDFE